jgi:hypothetical protein
MLMCDEGKMKNVIKDYLERMVKAHKTLESTSTDRNIDCPKCKTYRAFAWRGGQKGYWGNCYSCGFKFPENLAPPSPIELEEIFAMKDKERRMNEVIGLIQELGLSI